MTVVPELSVVIPAYRAEGHLEACLAALRTQSAAPDRFEVIVVDDHSPDGTAELAHRLGARVLRHERNRGAAAARNTGARAARGELLLFVDSDVVPDRDLVAGALAAFTEAEVQAATGRYDPEPANPTRFARYKALWTFWCWEQSGAATGESSHLQGALAAVRRDLLLELGGFDERYEGGNVEDYELSARLRERGVRIAFDDRLRGRHHFPEFGTVARNYWDRTRMWVRLRRQGGRGFSSGQASRRSAGAAVLALTSAAGHATLPLSLPLLPLTLAADLGWLVAVGPFLRYAAQREGPAFALYAATAHYALCVVVGAAAVGAPLGRGSRRAGDRA